MFMGATLYLGLRISSLRFFFREIIKILGIYFFLEVEETDYDKFIY